METRVYLGARRSDHIAILADFCMRWRAAGDERANGAEHEEHGRSCAIGRDLANPGDWT